MWRTSGLLALLIGAMLPAEVARGQFSHAGSSFVEWLGRHDQNGNGRIDAHERAALVATDERQRGTDFTLPLICDGPPAVGGGGGSTSTEDQQQLPASDVARQVRWRRLPFAERQTDDQAQPHEPQDDQLAAEAAGQYDSGPPAPQPPQAQPVRFRRAVQYRMMLNEQQRQPRPQYFARAATFGPTIGLTKRYAAARADTCCGCCRATILAGVGY